MSVIWLFKMSFLLVLVVYPVLKSVFPVYTKHETTYPNE